MYGIINEYFIVFIIIALLNCLATSLMSNRKSNFSSFHRCSKLVTAHQNSTNSCYLFSLLLMHSAAEVAFDSKKGSFRWNSMDFEQSWPVNCLHRSLSIAFCQIYRAVSTPGYDVITAWVNHYIILIMCVIISAKKKACFMVGTLDDKKNLRCFSLPTLL